MQIIFSDHAKFQLRKRKISQKLVKNAVLNPQSTESSFKERKLLRRLVGDKLLEVVIKTEGSRTTVITSYYLK